MIGQLTVMASIVSCLLRPSGLRTVVTDMLVPGMLVSEFGLEQDALA